MEPTHSGAGWELYTGDCIEVMRTLPAGSVDAIVTSPPYAEQRKSTYGGIPEKDYPDWTVMWMSEAWRLLKPDGSVIINISPHIKEGQISDYVLRTRLALRRAGWAELDEIVWHKRDAMPTGSPRRPRRSWESLLWFGKHGRAWSDAKAAGQPHSFPNGFARSDAAKANGWGHGGTGGVTAPSGRVRVANVVALPKPKRSEYHHPAPFHWKLPEWCGKLICPPGGTILDPFNGSGTTGVAALRNGWHYIGIDEVEEYIQMSQKRLEHEQGSDPENRT